MLVFCSHRGLSLACKHCSHAMAHQVEKLSFSGLFTCDGGHRCSAPMAEVVTKGICAPMVWGGKEMVGEVKCVPVAPKRPTTPIERMDTEIERRGLSRDEVFFRLANHKHWLAGDWDRWIETGKCSMKKLRELAEVIDCRMDDIFPLPPGATGVQISCGENGCKSEVVYPGDKLLAKARTAIEGLLRDKQTWAEKRCSVQHAQAVAKEIKEHQEGQANERP